MINNKTMFSGLGNAACMNKPEEILIRCFQTRAKEYELRFFTGDESAMYSDRAKNIAKAVIIYLKGLEDVVQRQGYNPQTEQIIDLNYREIFKMEKDILADFAANFLNKLGKEINEYRRRLVKN